MIKGVIFYSFQNFYAMLIFTGPEYFDIKKQISAIIRNSIVIIILEYYNDQKFTNLLEE